MIPLWQLCQLGKLDEVEATLAKKEGDLNSTDNFGNTALHKAVEFDRIVNIEMLKLLLADPQLTTINHMNNEGKTPVMYAMELNKLRALRELVLHDSVDLDTMDNLGRSLEDVARYLFLIILSTNFLET